MREDAKLLDTIRAIGSQYGNQPAQSSSGRNSVLMEDYTFTLNVPHKARDGGGALLGLVSSSKRLMGVLELLSGVGIGSAADE